MIVSVSTHILAVVLPEFPNFLHEEGGGPSAGAALHEQGPTATANGGPSVDEKNPEIINNSNHLLSSALLTTFARFS